MCDMLDEAARRSRSSRGQTFSDFLEITICALSGGAMEEQYLEIVKRYADGEKGKRAIDTLASMFGELVSLMEDSQADILGDLYMGAITFGEHGQYFTPEVLADTMARIVGDGAGKTVSDPCCGSGRMLLSAAKINPNRLFVGQDLDARCVKMTAINLALNGLRGRVVWGNSLTLEQRLVYLTGFNGKGFISVIQPDPIPETPPQPSTPTVTPKDVADGQMSLFAT